jgi:hypothetical protein
MIDHKLAYPHGKLIVVKHFAVLFQLFQPFSNISVLYFRTSEERISAFSSMRSHKNAAPSTVLCARLLPYTSVSILDNICTPLLGARPENGGINRGGTENLNSGIKIQPHPLSFLKTKMRI